MNTRLLIISAVCFTFAIGILAPAVGDELKPIPLPQPNLNPGKSLVQATVSRLTRRHANFSARDFSGIAGSAHVIWTPTGKAQIQFSALRNFDDWWDVYSSYNITRTLAVMPSLQVSPELSLRLRLERSRRDFRGPVFPLAGMPLRQDEIRGLQASLNWNPLRNLSFALSLQKEHRTSNQGDLDYTDTTSLLKTQLSF